MTPWAPIAIALAATIGTGLLVARWTGSAAFGISAASLVMALALFGLAQIATVAYVPAGILTIVAGGAFVAAWPGRGGRGRARPLKGR